MTGRTYIAIDLKSFYASVECIERGLDPMLTNLVVADPERTEKTICLAVSPSLKAYGIPGRARLFEVVQKVNTINADRRLKAPGRRLSGKSYCAEELGKNPELALDYIVAQPQMARYIEYSTRIYDVYLKYIAPEDIHVYSIDEAFMDVTNYLKTYKKSARELAVEMILAVLKTTGIPAAAGIGTNLYLCKVAMDIMAKHVSADENGVRIAELDELTYRKLLWGHRPLTDFWRVGRGYAKKLESHGMFTMGDVARCSIGRADSPQNEALLYRLFGVNAELLIDHAWGWESCSMKDIKAYRPSTNSFGTGQVLHCPYSAEKAKLIVREMAEQLALDLMEKDVVTDQIILTVGYDIENLKDPNCRKRYRGEIVTDYYGRSVPKHAHGTANLKEHTSSAKQIVRAVMELFDQIVDMSLLVRRVNLTANHVVEYSGIPEKDTTEQLSLFVDYTERERQRAKKAQELERERRIQGAVLEIKKKYGKNAILKGTSLEEGATAMDRNRQIGGHKA